jgi:hypothetical protein
MTIENHIAQMILSCREVGNEFDHAVTRFYASLDLLVATHIVAAIPE